METHLDRLQEHIIEKSKFKTFQLARTEWDILYIQKVENGQCPCGKKNLKTLCHIENRFTGEKTAVGSDCIKRFFKDELAEIIVTELLRIAKNPNARPKPVLVELAYKDKVISDRERQILLDMQSPRRKPVSDRQAAFLYSSRDRIIVHYLR